MKREKKRHKCKFVPRILSMIVDSPRVVLLNQAATSQSILWLSELGAAHHLTYRKVSLHCSLLFRYEFQQSSKAMIPHEERNHYNIRSLKAESPVFPLPGHQFHPPFSRQFFMAERSHPLPPREDLSLMEKTSQPIVNILLIR